MPGITYIQKLASPVGGIKPGLLVFILVVIGTGNNNSREIDFIRWELPEQCNV